MDFEICDSTSLDSNEESKSSEKMYTYILKRMGERERDAERGRIVQTGKQTRPAGVCYNLSQTWSIGE